MSGAAVAQWHQILSLTDSLLVAANNGEWEQIERLEAQRRPLIFEFFQRYPNAKQSVTIAEDIAKILAQDRKVMELATKHQNQIAIELGRLKQNRHAIATYGRP